MSRIQNFTLNKDLSNFEDIFLPHSWNRIPPEPVFKEGFSYFFFFEGVFFDTNYFERLKNILEKLDETEFYLRGAARFSDFFRVVPTACSWDEYTIGRGDHYLIAMQPLNYYLFGKRSDWGIFVSTEMDMAIIGCKEKAVQICKEFAEGGIQEAKEWVFSYQREDRKKAFKRNYCD